MSLRKGRYVLGNVSDVDAQWKMEAFKFLMCLNVMKRDKVYLGTVRDNVKRKRRALNARQKASRRANRR